MVMMAKVMAISVCFLVALTRATMATTFVASGRENGKRKAKVQDGIVLDVHGEESEELPFEADEAEDAEAPSLSDEDAEAPVSLVETRSVCKDVEPEHTGFDVHDDNGFLKHAACENLAPQHCHNSSIGEQVRTSCPVSCFICLPPGGVGDTTTPCFDAASTGIRFRDGPKASCKDLINYCNHTSIGAQVSEACKLSCGLCELHVEGPYIDAYGNCKDLQTHEEPQFTINHKLAGCDDVSQFCKNHPDSYLIRHKCAMTCGVCGNEAPTTTTPPKEADDAQIPGDVGGCSRRRRWGFCSTRRRRNV